MTAFILRDVLAYSGQIAILIAAAALLITVLRLTPSARLHCLQLVLACVLALPLAQPWRAPVQKDTVTAYSGPGIPLTMGRGATGQSWTPSGSGILIGLICAGIAVRLGALGLGMMRFNRYLAKARFAPTAFARAKEVLGVQPSIFISEDLQGPVTYGLFRPAVLVPARWIESESVAYHELLHVRRRDWVFTMAEETIRAILWFHPLVWWLIARIQLAREEVVDREAVRLVNSRERYLDTLLAIAEAKAGAGLLPAQSFLKKRHLRQRVGAILNEVNMSKPRLRFSFAGFAAMLAVAGWMAARSFPLQAAPQAPQDAPGVTVQQDESKLLHRSPVYYPVDALKRGVQGTVLVEATLDTNGNVTDAQVLSGPQELRKAALQSILNWHYNKDAGLPPKIQIAIDFQLPSQQPGAPIPSKVVGPLPAADTTIKTIDLSQLPHALRDKAAAALPVHEGDQLTAASLGEAQTALSAVDEHLAIVIRRLADGAGVLAVTLRPGAGGVIGGALQTPSRIRVGGNVEALNLIQKVTPVYPPLAKQARVQGIVQFNAYIGKDGHVQNLELISGHPLLVAAAQEAVQQWIYRPTLLNGNPVDVVTQVDVNFTLLDSPGAPPAAGPNNRSGEGRSREGPVNVQIDHDDEDH